MNISLLLQMAAEAGPDRVSLVCNGRRWTYSELYYAALRAAAMFKACDCAYVALLDESSEAAPIALFGAAIAGIPYVPLNYRLADEDLAALLTRIEMLMTQKEAAQATFTRITSKSLFDFLS